MDCARCMASSLSNFVDNLAETIHKTKWKYGHDGKILETCGIKYKGCECCLEYTKVKDNLLIYKCSFCNTNYQKNFDEYFRERFFNTCRFSKRDINKFILMLRKVIYPYEYMDGWKKHHYLKKKIYTVT